MPPLNEQANAPESSNPFVFFFNNPSVSHPYKHALQHFSTGRHKLLLPRTTMWDELSYAGTSWYSTLLGPKTDCFALIILATITAFSKCKSKAFTEVFSHDEMHDRLKSVGNLILCDAASVEYCIPRFF